MRQPSLGLAWVLALMLPACGGGGSGAQPAGFGPWFDVYAYTALSPNPSALPGYPSSPKDWFTNMIVVDQDLDGDPDIVLPLRGAPGLATPTAYILLGTGAVEISQIGHGPVYYDTVGAQHAAASGDFDEDGFPDLLLARSDTPGLKFSAYGGGVDGMAYWWWMSSQALSAEAGRVVVGDWDEDGHLDAAVTLPLTGINGLVMLLPGNGDGSFGRPFMALPFPLVAGADPRDLIAADLDADGHLDLATANYGDDTVSVFLGGGDGTFEALPPIAATGGPVALAVGDLNGDGAPDLAVAAHRPPLGAAGTPPKDQIDILLAGGGTFALDSIVFLEPHELPNDLIAADIDGDGDVDLAYTSQTQNAVGTLRNTGAAAFVRTTPARIYVDIGPTQMEVADLNLDGKPDVAVLCPTAGRALLLRNVTD